MKNSPGPRPPDHSPGAENVSVLWGQLKIKPAQPWVWLRLAQHYGAQGLLLQAAYVTRQALRLDALLEPELRSLSPTPDSTSLKDDACLGRPVLEEGSTLAARFLAVLAVEPGDWLTCLYAARLAEMTGASATSLIAEARKLEPIEGESLHKLGVWRLNAGDAAGAIAAFSGLLDVRPMRTGSMMYLGDALMRTGRSVAAEKAFARASLSSNAAFLVELAGKVYAHNYWQEALRVMDKALSIRPGHVPTLLALARMQSEVYYLADCQNTLARIAQLDPQNAEANLLRAGLQGRMGDAVGHLGTLQAAYAQDENPLSRLASSIAMTSLYNDSMSPLEVADLHRRVCAPITTAFRQRTAFNNQLTAGRRLRVGLVTGDLYRQHPVNIFMLPILKRLDSDRMEVCVYYTGTRYDDFTRQAKSCTRYWREAATMDDIALQSAIVADEVDVLIDLAGHTASHRLGVFALRAAPVQATFLGYPHSTGLTNMDWLIGDATVSPADHAMLFSEGIAQLPGSVFCWHDETVYELPMPRASDAAVVFGSFNNAMKLSMKTVALWARVLHAVPGSRLLLKAPSLRDAAVRTRFTSLFENQGIASERLELRGPSGLADMMQEYGDIDIALDPTPYNGGTTTLQALWMGVPVIALAGGNFVSRMGASFLTTLGQTDWLAENEDAYVRAAAALAENCHELRGQRAHLRERMAASGLGDISSYVKHFETLLHAMWALHCSGSRQKFIGVPS
ncbi:MAG: hypothetical protein V4731_13595 [Pseudomonadota bacterium]